MAPPTVDPGRSSDPLPVRIGVALTRLLLRAYPERFRRRFARSVRQNSRDVLLLSHARHGAVGAVSLLPRLAGDLLHGGLQERFRPRNEPSPDSIPMLDTSLQDLRFAGRAMRRHPGLTALAVFTLALGIGATSSMFSVIDAVLLRALPYPDPDRLMSVFTTIPQWQEDAVLSGIWNRTEWSYDEFVAWRELQSSFTQAAVHEVAGANLVGLGAAERILAGLADLELLPMLGAVPLHGRFFSEQDRDAGARVAVVSFGFWRDRLGGTREALGRTLEIDGESYEVVGVLPDGFEFDRPVPVWLPIFENRPWGYFPGNTGDMDHLLRVTARLTPGVTTAQAEDELARLLPEIGGPDHFTTHSAVVLPRLTVMTAGVRYPLLVLMGAVLLLLLVACANVATFLLGQAIDRQQEIAVRGALGAGRTRVARQLVTESLTLATIGGVAGVILASQGVRALAALAPADLPRLNDISLDARAVAFSMGISLLAGLLFGLAPAITLARADLARILGATRSGSEGRSRLQGAMVVAEVAIATLLLVGAGLLIRSFQQLNAVDPGFDPEGIVRVRISPDTSRFFDSAGEFQAAAMGAYIDEVAGSLRTVPGVEDLSVTEMVPFGGGGANNNVTGEGYEGQDGWQTIAHRRFVDPSFHRTLGIELLHGRLLDAGDDREDAASVVLVSESLARRFWAAGEAVGKQLNWWGQDSEVVGVVADIRERRLDAEPEMTFYAPRLRWSSLGGNFLLAVDGEPADLVASVRTALNTRHPELVVINVEPLTEMIAASLAESRYRTRLIGVFAAVAALLSVIGLYAVTARSVAARFREIGIRRALGAESGKVVGMLVRDGVRLAAAGAAIGVAAALAGTRFLAGFLFGVAPHDPLTLLAIGTFVAAMAVFASLLPSLRAARFEAVEALRAD